MKALVTGANGFTGSHLVRLLLAQGHEVIGFVRPTSNLQSLADLKLKLVKGDLTNHEALREAMTGVEIVFHTAAYVEIGVVNAAEMERVNLEGTRAVLEVAKTASVTKLVYCSTIGVFGDTRGEAVDETYQRTQVGFSSVYDRTKLEAQQLVDQFASQGFWTVSVMPSGIFGPGDPHFGPVLQRFLKGQLKVLAGGDRLTGIVHVDDLAQGMILAAERGQPGAWYILSAGELTTREMFQGLARYSGVPAPAYELPEFLVRSLGYLLDPIGRAFNWQPPASRERVHYLYDRLVRVKADKARQELGWQPRSVDEVLRELVKA
ncbi:NAD-dependent epimerase/dehydratase family protein [Leptolyngbya sp. FACHB-261]|uniref:NAD-dependent epimerase/dehydratase family protein n=1 Tax=Leptolyngbya sp. FACHB-261 TaxID=2692806 RepID=UPI0016831D94|nr:NAD-dependent epimerase/dehydratase family protein [Leptolyngbya sp. FACHB-261]MBD2102153.1 NAD-dependent epimerase/dehydratase family protein [Leptolyngbya sp. FACHB-261]